MTLTDHTAERRAIAAELAATAADIAADIRLMGHPCPASVDYARDLLAVIAAFEPIPFTLTPKATDFLAHTRQQIAIIGENGDGWACGRCGSAWFGSVPADGQCPDCADLTAAELADSEAQARWEQEADAAWWETVLAMEDAGLLGEPTDAEDAQ